MVYTNTSVISNRSHNTETEWNPHSLVKEAGKFPSFSFTWGDPGKKGDEETPRKRKKKRRLIGRPDGAMRKLHELFKVKLHKAVEAMGRKNNYTLRELPSASGCVLGTNQLKNIERHGMGEFFYITDFANAYQSVDLDRLTILLVYIFKYQHWKASCSLRNLSRNLSVQADIKNDSMYENMRSFVSLAFAGIHGRGLAVGGPLSPYLLNLYCEVYLDSRIRSYFEKREVITRPECNVVMSRFVDDLVLSSGIIISSDVRRDIRKMINEAGFEVNHLKSRVLKRSMGTVFITGLGMRIESDDDVILEEGTLTFPRKKRRRIEGALQSYIKPSPSSGEYWNDSPAEVLGLAAEFIYYCKYCRKNLKPLNKSDERTLALWEKFMEMATPHLKNTMKAIERRRERRPPK